MKDEGDNSSVIFGGGGHARMLVTSLLDAGGTKPVAIVDPESSLHGSLVFGVSVVGSDEEIRGLVDRGVRFFVVGLGSTGDNEPRRRLYEFGLAEGLAPLAVVHPSAIVSPFARLGAGAQLMPGSVINAGATLGANVLVNSRALVEHDCELGDHVHVASGACLSGGVRVDPLAHVGVGATVRQGVGIGEAAVVGAGAVVVGDVAPGTTVVGVPARPVRPIEQGPGVPVQATGSDGP